MKNLNFGKNFFVRTFGCQMNAHESDKIVSLMNEAGYQEVKTETDADIIIFNTCCIRNTAEQKIMGHIGKTKEYKRVKPNLIVCVVGCMTQRDGFAPSLCRKFTHIDVVLGTHNIEEIVGSVLERKKTGARVVKIQKERKPEFVSARAHEFVTDANYKNESDGVDITCDDENVYDDNGKTSFNLGKDGGVRYVNITYGCENFCSYCIVPYVRGKLISRDIEVIKCEVIKILKSGFSGTIYLLGQNVNSYLCPRTGANFVRLLDEVCAIKHKFALNFLSSHPKDFSDELIDAISRNKKIERNIHLPLQSGCDRILALMRRGYTVEEYEQIVNKLRASVPSVHITTDIICGFVSESEEDFEETKRTISRIKFNASFIYPYSRRSGTLADTFEGQIDEKTKRRRTTELIALQREISRAYDRV